MIDPLAIFLRGEFEERGLTPLPLVSTDHEVEIRSGLAEVTTHRLFRNLEGDSIEAVLTFPLPIHAVLFELVAEVEGRRLMGMAQSRQRARQTYEDAIETGKSAVLHEEVLRGLHMISVANIRPGGEIKITTRWAAPLSVIAGSGFLRIPQSVGDIYGRSGLSEADDILVGGPAQPVLVSIRSDCSARLVGDQLVNGHARLKSSRPIDIITDLWKPSPVSGRLAGGGSISLTLSPQPSAGGDLSLAVVVDKSGSMNGSDRRGEPSAHEMARSGIHSLATRLEAGDLLDLWEFNTAAAHLGQAPGSDRHVLARLASQLSEPSGGTEIGRSLHQVIRASTARDILLLTDGRSHALDVASLARSGRRFSVVLIGKDSLEARVGHLAALTGGDILIASASDLEPVLSAAVDGLRRAGNMPAASDRLPERLACTRNGVLIEAEWAVATVPESDPGRASAAAAVATSLAIGSLPSGPAAELAAAQGIVSHLTSLVLVDEAGDIREGLPGYRKIALATEMEALALPSIPPSMESLMLRESISAGRGALSASDDYLKPTTESSMSYPDLGSRFESTSRRQDRSALILHVRRLAAGIDWGRSPDSLLAGSLSELPVEAVRLIDAVAGLREARNLADHLGLPIEILVLGLLANLASDSDRRAHRVWASIAARSMYNLSEHLEFLKQIMIEGL